MRQQISSAGTKSHQNVPACTTMGTLRLQNVPKRQQFSSAGTKSHQNVPAYRRVGTLRHQNVPGRQQFSSVGTKSHQNVPACTTMGTLRHQNVPKKQQIPSVGTLQRQKLLFTWEHSLNNTLLHLQYPLQLFVGSIIAKFQETCDFNFLLFAQQLGFR